MGAFEFCKVVNQKEAPKEKAPIAFLRCFNCFGFGSLVEAGPDNLYSAIVLILILTIGILEHTSPSRTKIFHQHYDQVGTGCRRNSPICR